MHEDELELDEAHVRRLLAEQFPEWSEMPVRRIEPSGTVNAIFRLGDDLCARLPRRRGPTEPGSNELEWLPKLAPQLPVEVPVPVAQGRPGAGYPWFWEIHTWVEGKTVPVEEIDAVQAAQDLAALVLAMHRVDPAGAPPGRGIPLAERDPQMEYWWARFDGDPRAWDTWKRALAAAFDDHRLVPGHPLAGGASGGPARAAADLFDGATWFLTPLPASDAARVELVERFVGTLGARAVRLDPETHDRLLALTSHLPHALANLLMQDVAASGDEALGYAGASLREMTRVAGANPIVWADIFVENGDLIADALTTHREALGDVERALRTGDRAFFEQWITQAAEARNRMLEYAYRTEARMLNRIRIRIPDKPGVIARITQSLGAAGINIEDFELRHVSPEYGGVLVILVSGADNAELARTLLRREGYSAA